MAVGIDAYLLDQLTASAAASPDAEICGLLFGGDHRIDAARPARNVAPVPARAFEIDPAALIAALRAERAGGPRLIGHYHSHPGGDATPSPRDLAAAGPDLLWLILGGQAARLWRPGRGRFDEVALVVG